MVSLFLRITLIFAALMTASGAWIFFDPSSGLGQNYGLPADVPMLYRALLGFVLALFAGMYAWMAAQSTVVRPLLWLGVIGKGGAFATMLLLYAAGKVSVTTAMMLLGDAILAVIWLVWLIKHSEPV